MLINESLIIKKYLEEVTNKVVLNIGSSDARYYKELQPQIWRNIIQPLLQRGNRVIHLDKKKADGVDEVGDCRDMRTVRDKSIDVVLFSSVLEHLLNPKKVLSEIHRVLKDDGIVIASAPGVYPYHVDPIDNLIRLPEQTDWAKFLEERWEILNFEKTAGQPADDYYHFAELVFATVVTARKAKDLSRLKVAAFLLSYKREENLGAVVAGLRRQSFIENIYLFHNHPSSQKIEGVINTVSDKNFRCIVRHALAQIVETDYVLFIDDDLELLTDLSPRFIKALEMEPEAVVGLFGHNIDPEADTDRIYASGGSFGFKKNDFYRYVDLVVGRCHLVKRKFLGESFRFINEQFFPLDNFTVIRDDVILNLAIQLKTRTPGLLIPSDPAADYRDLADHDAVCSMQSHYLMRSHIIKEFMAHGWKARANKGRFLKHNLESGGAIVQQQNLVVKLRRQVEKNNLKNAHRLYRKISKAMKKEYGNLVSKKLKYNLAGLYREEGHFWRAARLYRELVEAGSAGTVDYKALSHFHLGMLALQRSAKESARDHFRRCLAAMPHHQEAARQLKNFSL